MKERSGPSDVVFGKLKIVHDQVKALWPPMCIAG
jgi:hypothetical protein